jgi:hypothetical protein
VLGGGKMGLWCYHPVLAFLNWWGWVTLLLGLPPVLDEVKPLSPSAYCWLTNAYIRQVGV